MKIVPTIFIHIWPANLRICLQEMISLNLNLQNAQTILQVRSAKRVCKRVCQMDLQASLLFVRSKYPPKVLATLNA